MSVLEKEVYKPCDHHNINRKIKSIKKIKYWVPIHTITVIQVQLYS